jgi:hypothetical protein
MAAVPPRSHLTHAELDSPGSMSEDCRAVGDHLRLDRVARAAVVGAPSLEYADYPREIPKRDIATYRAAARLAAALNLSLD